MSIPVYSMTDTWNNGGTVFAGLKMSITNTASAPGSKTLDIQVGGQSVVEHSLSQNGTFVIRAQPPHGQQLSITPRNDTNGALTLSSGSGFYFDSAINIGAGSPVSNTVSLSSVASGTTRTLKVTPGVINLPPITAPSAPQNGDMWMQSDGLYVRVNGVTLKVTAA
jgi:hypothetical protein